MEFIIYLYKVLQSMGNEPVPAFKIFFFWKTKDKHLQNWKYTNKINILESTN